MDIQPWVVVSVRIDTPCVKGIPGHRGASMYLSSSTPSARDGESDGLFQVQVEVNVAENGTGWRMEYRLDSGHYCHR